MCRSQLKTLVRKGLMLAVLLSALLVLPPESAAQVCDLDCATLLNACHDNGGVFLACVEGSGPAVCALDRDPLEFFAACNAQGGQLIDVLGEEVCICL